MFCAKNRIGAIAMAPLHSNPFPDARPEFFRAVERAVKLGMELPLRILRTVRPKQPREYQEQVRRADCTESSYISPAQLPFEFMLNALRLNEGFSVRDYRRGTGLGIDSVAAKLAAGESRGLLERRPDGWRPTGLGRRFLNDLQGSFLP